MATIEPVTIPRVHPVPADHPAEAVRSRREAAASAGGGPIDPAKVPILGPPSATAAQAGAYARGRGARRGEALAAFIGELWRLGEAAGYDPAVVFAQFCDETGSGASEAWATRLNPGGLGITDGHDFGLGFRSGEDAARAMLVHLSVYVRGYDPALWKYIGLDPRYLEPLKLGFGATVKTLADLGNGVWASNPRYAEQIARHLAAIRATNPVVLTPAAAPVSGVQPAAPPLVWLGTGNWHPRPAGSQPEAIVYHVTDDLNFNNVRGHFQNPGSRASSHFVVERDGALYQFVATRNAAWTNGDVANPRTDLPWLNATLARCHDAARNPDGAYNVNDFCVTIECMGKPDLPFPDAQIQTVIALTRYLLARYPAITPIRGRLLRHADVNRVSRSYCPGPNFPLAEIIAAVGGDPLALV